MRCQGCILSRRGFLAAGCAAAGAMVAGMPKAYSADTAGKLKIRVVYSLHAEKQPGPDWPNVGFDFAPVMDKVDGALAQACPGYTFIRSLATGKEQAEKILADDTAAGDVDGYIVYQMNCWNQVVQTMVTSGKPVLYADFQFAGSGGFLVYTAGFLRTEAPNLGFVASSRIDDVIAAVRCFDIVKTGGTASDFAAATARVRRQCTPKPGETECKADAVKALSPAECMERVKGSKILAFLNQEAKPLPPFAGVPVEHVPFAELNDAWAAADKDESRAVADRWEKNATAVVDVPRKVLEDSAAMYLAEKAVMAKHGANAITINCLGGFYGGHIHAYPCLGFHQLNSEGLVGGCECDVASAATMVTFSALSQGRPGYISDPVMDSAKRQIIYAHCVASNRAFGPQGETNPYEILTHSEDRQGASVRSILPVGYMTTTLQLSSDRKEILFHQGKAVANDPDDRACRTKLCVEPKGDFEKLFSMWDRWGLAPGHVLRRSEGTRVRAGRCHGVQSDRRGLRGCRVEGESWSFHRSTDWIASASRRASISLRRTPCRAGGSTTPCRGGTAAPLYECDEFVRSRLSIGDYDLEDEACKVAGVPLRRFEAVRPSVQQPRSRRSLVHGLQHLRPQDRRVAARERSFVVVAHKDSQSWMDRGPGAYDNAAGTSAALEIARVLADYPTRRSLWFLFCNEEHTPWTSVRAAQRVAKSGLSVMAVLNLDSLGGKSDDDARAGRKTCVARFTTPEGEAVADLLGSLNESLELDLHYGTHRCERPNDDDGSFVKAGIPAAILLVGSFPYEDPRYHTENDTVGTRGHGKRLSCDAACPGRNPAPGPKRTRPD